MRPAVHPEPSSSGIVRYLSRAALAVPFTVLLLALAVLAPPASAAVMDDYCQYPPYVFQSTVPSVNLVISNSKSMLNFEYFDGWDNPLAVPNMCDNASARCYQYNPAKTYYGYFNSSYYYSYASNRWTRTSDNVWYTKQNPAYWNGNFLNWLTMRRVDALRKVLTGGTNTSQEACSAAEGIYKAFQDNGTLTAYDTGGSWYRVNFSTGCSGTSASSMTVLDNAGVSLASYVVNVNAATGEGILQGIAGTKANVALTFLNSDGQGGGINPEFGSPSPISSLVNRINTPSNFNGLGTAPLGEALWTVTGQYTQSASLPSSAVGACSAANCGPRYHNGDYSTTAAINDPYYYKLGNHLSTCVKGYVVLLSDGEPSGDGAIPDNVLNFASGKSLSCDGCTCAANASMGFAATTIPGCTSGNATSYAGIEDVTLWAHTRDLRTPTLGKSDIQATQKLDFYVIRAFGKGQSNLLKYAAINGNFVDLDNNAQPDPGEYQLSQIYYEATDGYRLSSVISQLFNQLLRNATSGTAASVLASGEGSGANLVQAVFYPRRRFGDQLLEWTGSLQNMWYYVDPRFSNSTIREDSDYGYTTPERKLNLDYDNVVVFYYDEASGTTKVRKYDTDAHGDNAVYRGTVAVESAGYIWEAGSLLQYRAPSSRLVYTDNGTSRVPFTTAYASDLSAWLAPDTATAANPFPPSASDIISYVRGQDDFNGDNVADYRSRTRYSGVTPYVWKLGDVVNSTPKVIAGSRLNYYYENYGDRTYLAYTQDNAYRSRGSVFVGGNDGMLHAFKLGQPTYAWSGQTEAEKAWLRNPNSSTPLGYEDWAFIPRNALPYLKYQLDNNYCHIYTVDLPPTLIDASIGGSASTDNLVQSHWRTVLVGGMRYGGACSNSCAPGSDCVGTPTSGKGFSSYFALDVTTPSDPAFLWEFSSADLGFSTTGPAIVRVSPRNGLTGEVLPGKDGQWYAVFGSGPTGPIDNTYRQFLGRSNQNLRLFVVDLKTGELVRTIDTGIANAFAGAMTNSTADYNLDYEDDAIYFGYTKVASDGTFTQGGVGRLVLKNGPAVDDWTFSRVIDDIGPVTSSVARLQNVNYGTSWLFFGTGRYFFEMPNLKDDPTNQRRLFGVREPSSCFPHIPLGGMRPTINPECTATVSYSSLTDATTNLSTSESTANAASFAGWRIDLDTASTATYDNVTRYYRAERVVTDTLATTQGVVFFTSFRPYSDDCALGGKSFLWAVRYNTGGVPNADVMKGKATMQVSTASVEQLDLSSAFAPAAGEGATGLHRGGRRSAAMEGVPPTGGGPSIVSPPPPVKRLIHMRER
jgi:type IV pilus assembly protein PilY1